MRMLAVSSVPATRCELTQTRTSTPAPSLPTRNSGARYARGRQGDAAAALSHELNEERMMARMGDTMVPIDKARHQKPRFLGDALYQ